MSDKTATTQPNSDANASEDLRINIRLPSQMVSAIDAELDSMIATMPGAALTRSDAIRVLITRGLTATSSPAPKGRAKAGKDGAA